MDVVLMVSALSRVNPSEMYKMAEGKVRFFFGHFLSVSVALL